MLNKGKLYDNLPDEYLNMILNFEGGYVNHPLDKGGETNRGITIGALTAAKEQGIVAANVTIRDLTDDLESVRVIYEQNYYLRSKANMFQHPLALAHFDASVNHGCGNSGKFLQRTLNIYGAHIDVDGAIGPKTLTAYEQIISSNNIIDLANTYNIVRLSFYNAIVANNPKQKVFYNGWMNRLNKVKAYCEDVK